MESATKNFNGVICYVGVPRAYDEDIPAEMTTEAVRDVLKRLAAYEDAEEQGRLVWKDVLTGKEKCDNITTG